jgi:hypothetical protein
MVMDLEYVHNRDVFDVLTVLGSKMAIGKHQRLGSASDHV